MKNPQDARYVLITGATSGIGRDAALHLARRGDHVIATGRRSEALASLKEEAEGELTTLQLDVTDAASIESAREVVERLTDGRGLDVLVNNAGFGIVGPALEISDEDLRAQFETNLFGLMAVTRAFAPRMVERRSGRIVNVSSIGGRYTVPFFGAYNATKYALESLSDALRNELAPFGVSVVLVEPGPIKTNFGEVSMSWVERYRRPDSPYAPVFARSDEIKASFDASAANPDVVTRAIERAIHSRRPAARYVAPFRYRLALALAALLPTRWTDALIRRALGLNADLAGAPAAAPPASAAAEPIGEEESLPAGEVRRAQQALH